MSFGERLSTRLFAAFLNAQGIKAKQYDAYAIGVTTNDNFVNAEVRVGTIAGRWCVAAPMLLPCMGCFMPMCACCPTDCHPCPPFHRSCAQVNYQLTLPAVKEALTFKPGQERHLPIVTGFLGRGLQTGAITTLGRGGSDLTCTLLGASLGLPEVQVWKDVDGVLTADPRVVSTATPVARLTFEEATELAVFGATVLHPLAMQPAHECNVGVRVKNSYNR